MGAILSAEASNVHISIFDYIDEIYKLVNIAESRYMNKSG